MRRRNSWLDVPRPLLIGVAVLLILGVLFSLRPEGLPPVLTVVLVAGTVLLLATAAMVAAYRFFKDFSTRP
ncbi:MAG: hypothetical protein H7Y22_02080 [Gemmatimonadaceae bacterium]|nr:hypothetical protein [Gloeobacterales cyanobacterium ES-bin-141]